MEIEWKPVAGYEGRYSVSNDGRVWSHLNDRELRPGAGKRDNRPICVLYDSGKPRSHYVHRLVCEAFHGPAPEGKNWVLHWDDNPLNNRADNLRWGSARENSADARRNGWDFSGGLNKDVCQSGKHEWIPGVTTVARQGGITCRECARDSNRRSRNQQLSPNDPRHGTVPGGRAGCRCEECLPVWRAYRKEQCHTSYMRKKARDGV